MTLLNMFEKNRVLLQKHARSHGRGERRTGSHLRVNSLYVTLSAPAAIGDRASDRDRCASEHGSDPKRAVVVG